MFYKKLSKIITVIFIISMASIANATPILHLQTSGGKLVGAQNVDVNGTFYDVEFLDGRCDSLFNGCDNAKQDFAFTTQIEALYAASALIDKVLLDGLPGKFDTFPGRTTGCTDTFSCAIWIPYGLYTAFDGNHVNVVKAINTQSFDYTVGSNAFVSEDTAKYTYATYARFQKAKIPEPDVLGLLAAGAVAGFMARRRQRRAN